MCLIQLYLIISSIGWFASNSQVPGTDCNSVYLNLEHPCSTILFDKPIQVGNKRAFAVDSVKGVVARQSSPITGDAREMLKNWMYRLGYDINDEEMLYVGTKRVSLRQKYHFIVLSLDNNAQVVFMLVEYRGLMTSIVHVAHFFNLPFGDYDIAQVVRLSPNRCIIEQYSISGDTMNEYGEPDMSYVRAIIAIKQGRAILHDIQVRYNHIL